jgi:MATE family multidrug resistance protein
MAAIRPLSCASLWGDRRARELVTLAWPIAISLLSYSVMTAVDTLFVGRVGPSAIAAVGLGGVVSFTLLTFGLGSLRAVKIRVAYAVGAGRLSRVATEVRAALWLSLVYAVFTLVGTVVIAPRLPGWAGNSVGELAQDYVWARSLSIPFVLAACALREASQAAGDSRSPMRAAVIANLANLPLNAWLVLGLGWGVTGSALANVLAQVVECALLVTQRRAWLRDPFQVGREDLSALVRLGWPQGLEFFLDVSSFSALALVIARMGAVDMAAHQIVLQVVHLSWLPLIAVGDAACVLAGQAMGGRQPEQVPRTALTACLSGWVVAFLAGACLGFGRQGVTQIFTDDRGVQQLAASLLRIAALAQLVFVPYIVLKGVLRGAGDIRFAAIATVVVAWAATPTLAYLLGVGLGWGARGGWWGLATELTVASLLFTWRLWSGQWRQAMHAELDAEPARASSEEFGNAVVSTEFERH